MVIFFCTLVVVLLFNKGHNMFWILILAALWAYVESRKDRKEGERLATIYCRDPRYLESLEKLRVRLREHKDRESKKSD